MVHVLDHLVDPLRHLGDIHRCLRPGGLLSIVVHNEQSILARGLGKRNPIFSTFHPQLFNPGTLISMVEKAGFEVIGIRRTCNYYPVMFAANVLLHKFGFKRLRLPELSWLRMPLPLGNMQLVARATAS